MTNYKLYKILRKEKADNNAYYVFYLDDYVCYKSDPTSTDEKPPSF